jgi:hypothetical protein
MSDIQEVRNRVVRNERYYGILRVRPYEIGGDSSP